MDDVSKASQAPRGWLDSLERSEADLAAGRTVSGDGLMHRLKEMLAELEARDTQRGRKAKRRV